jgi:hypothetical protein
MPCRNVNRIHHEGHEIHEVKEENAELLLALAKKQA